MYVIGRVESNHNWSAINPSDPITLGMMQWYGNRAKGLLLRGRAEDESGFNHCNSTDGGMCEKALVNADMTYYYVNSADADAWRVWANTDANHRFQQNQWESDYADYVKTCDNYGFPANNMRERIFFMTMWHQGPLYAQQVIRSCSATANLELLHSTCLNNRVLGQYRNRYNTAYDLLKNWDGQSAPPNFGQVVEPTPTPPDTGGNPEPIQPTPASKRWIILNGDNLYLHDGTKVSTFKKSTGQNWVESGTKGTPIQGGQTGGGESTGAPKTDAQKVWELYHSWENRFQYSQGAGRLNPLQSGYGDCSSTIWRAYQDAVGIDVGTWTGAMRSKGRRIAISTSDSFDTMISRSQVGDLLLLTWRGGDTVNYDHVDMVSDDKRLFGHGGPGKGPTFKTFESRRTRAIKWELRRYV